MHVGRRVGGPRRRSPARPASACRAARRRSTSSRRASSQASSTQTAPDTWRWCSSTSRDSVAKGRSRHGRTAARISSRRSAWPTPRPAVKQWASAPDEQQVEQRLLGADRAGEGRRDRDRLLEGRRRRAAANVSSTSAWRTKNSSWYSLHHRPADARPAPPVDALQRIARPVVAQGHELLRVADRGRERDPARLVPAAAAGAPAAAADSARGRISSVAGRRHDRVSARTSPSGSGAPASCRSERRRPRRRGVSSTRASHLPAGAAPPAAGARRSRLRFCETSHAQRG